jgi:hypothetical protein
VKIPAEQDLPQHVRNRILLKLRTETTLPAGNGRLRARILIAAAVACVAAGGTALATAGGSPVHTQDNGVVVVDGDQLLVSYHGREITQDEVAALMKRGKALFQVSDLPSAREGHMHAFDTQEEFEAYSQSVRARLGSPAPSAGPG